MITMRTLFIFGISIVAIGTAQVSPARAETTNEYWVYRWQELTGQCAERNDSACEAAKIVSDDLEKRGCVHAKGYWNCDVPGAGQGSKAPIAPASRAPLEPLVEKDCPVSGERVTVSGTIDKTRIEHHLSIFLPDDWSCLGNLEEMTVLSPPLSTKWLGHHVTVTGVATYTKRRYLIILESIKDISGTSPPDSKFADHVIDSKLAEISCGWVVKANKVRGADDAKTNMGVDYLEWFAHSGKLPDKYYWSGCTMYGYMVAECRAHPRESLLEAVNSLIGKAKAGKELPPIPICGA